MIFLDILFISMEKESKSNKIPGPGLKKLEFQTGSFTERENVMKSFFYCDINYFASANTMQYVSRVPTNPSSCGYGFSFVCKLLFVWFDGSRRFHVIEMTHSFKVGDVLGSSRSKASHINEVVRVAEIKVITFLNICYVLWSQL